MTASNGEISERGKHKGPDAGCMGMKDALGSGTLEGESKAFPERWISVSVSAW